jgi:Fe-S cluster biogenesis protein NfuA
MFINVEETPNPNTLKFIPEKNISVDKSYIFKKTDDLKNNEFLKNLFDIDGVESILIDSGFISVTKDNSSSWEVLRTILTSKIGVFLEKNNYVIDLTLNSEKVSDNKKPLTDMEKSIVELLETRVKPVVASHGGEISFNSFKNGTVYLELKGSCAGCPSSTATLKMGIENMLKHYHKDIKEVVEIN